MSTVTTAFTAVGVSAELVVRAGAAFDYAVSGTFVGTAELERNDRGGKGTWQPILSVTGAASGRLTAEEPSGKSHARYRWRCSAFTSGTIDTVLEDVTTVAFRQETTPGGAVVLEYTEDGPRVPVGKALLGPATAYSGSGSYQPIAPDLELAAAAGSDSGTNPKFLAAIMGNVLGDALTQAANYIAGVIGALAVTGARASLYPVAALMGVLFDGVADADAVVLAVVDGDDNSGNPTTARAAYGVAMNNNVAGSGVDYGLDLKGDANANYGGTPLPFTVRKGQLRFSEADVCVLTGDGAPVDGTTGDDFAGPGSLYIDFANANLYVQTGAIDATVWKLVTRAA